MIAHHAALARSLAEQLGLPDAVLEALGASTSSGMARAGRASSRASESRSRPGSRSSPSSSRSPTASAASTAATALARKRARQAVRPGAGRAAVRATPRRSWRASTRSRTWDAVIAAEPALAVCCRASGSTPRWPRSRTSSTSSRPYTLGHARAVADLAAAAGARARPGRGEVRTLRRAGLVHDLGRLGVSNSIWDKRGPLGAGEWERVRMHPVPHRAHAAPVAGARAARRDRRPAPRAARRLRLPARAVRRRRSPGRRGSSALPTPTRRCASRARTGRALSAEDAAAELRAEVKAGRLDADAVEAVLGAGRPPRAARREGPAGLTAARGRGAAAARARAVEQGDRRSSS